MVYGAFYLLALIQNAAFLRLVRTACGFERSESRIVLFLAAALSAVPQLVLLFPSAGLPKLLILLVPVLLMLLRAGCYAAAFRCKKISMLYISILSFALNANYSNIVKLFTTDWLPLNFAACAAELVLTAAALLYIQRKNNAEVIAESLSQIPRRLCMLILGFLYFMSVFEYSIVNPAMNTVSRALLLPVILMTAYIITRIMKINAKAREQERISAILSEQLENQVSYYQKINDIYTEFRAFRHDYRNHLLCLRGLLAENEVARACEYMDQIAQMSRSHRKTFDTGNIIVDSLLNDKNEKAAQSHAQILFSGFAPTTGITNADLCTVFANALDNAIEACAKDSSSDEKEIAVHSDFRQGYFTLRITNPVFEKVEIRSHNQVETSKADKGMHGFGVANIVRTAKKYGGDAALSAENGIFTLEVGLWLNPEL